MNEKLLRILGKSRKSVWKLIEEWNADLNSFLKILSEAYRKGEIEVEDGKVKGVNLFYCKGCGLCAAECPKDAIKMVKEEL